MLARKFSGSSNHLYVSPAAVYCSCTSILFVVNDKSVNAGASILAPPAPLQKVRVNYRYKIISNVQIRQ